ncbi:tetratricopeptide repeat protein [Streptomyces sp. NRRL WC-3626]|uniref:tetratricopeptide repeat protein n=1 Tax=Streptomyces sp. NRRL WC-3626 TaxID=1463926 RepID=UPI0004C0EEDD|nr:tetratricopeptide repeat protein [Streptomyces sp. NRRL WC-3626]
MSRLSREKKREQQQAADAVDPAAAPIDVHVPLGGTGASVGGVTVIAGPGEEIQQAVLNRLHRIAIASGHAALATVHDERVGCVIPLRVDPDGSSHFTGQPVLTEPPRDREPAPTPGTDLPTHLLRPVPEQAAHETASAPPAPHRDSAPTFKLRPLPGPGTPRDAAPTFPLRAVPEPAEPTPPGTVVPPTGEFGPPPPMDARPHPEPGPVTPAPESAYEPDPKPTPPRGFDAVAEAVLGDEPPAAENHLAEPMARINDAVRTGRIDEAARLAEETVTEASGTLGPDHPEVLRLRELAAYIAYLAGEPLRAFRISLDLAVICRRAGDAEAAYGNVRSAATAWRAVRDPGPGLELGHELITLWTELTTEDGPAADEIEELESARARMGRLTERAR